MAGGKRDWTDTTPAEFLPGFRGRTAKRPDGPHLDTFCNNCGEEGHDDDGRPCPHCGEGTMLWRDAPDEDEEE